MQPIEPYKGVRDFYPEDERIQNYIFSAMRRAVESFGYEEYNASVLESTELYAAKSSAEIVNEQTYTFKDRGDRSVTLRPEMTPTVARMVAAKRRELGYPLRWYCIQNFFRYERPQRGRLREFWQLNADLFGVSGIEADVEAIEVAHATMKALGAKESMFTIRVNDRKLLEEKFGTKKSHEELLAVFRLMDKKNKMASTEFESEWRELTGEPFENVTVPNKTLEKVMEMLAARGITNVEFDPTLTRGFDYYTGLVFEVYDTDPKNSRSMFGGGRYDKLIGQYGDEDVPAVGFAMGDVPARNFLEVHELLPILTSTSHLYLAPVQQENYEASAKLANKLRSEGVNVTLGMKHEKIGDHIKAAVKLSIPYFVAFGEKEEKAKSVTLKVLSTEQEETVSIDNLASRLLS